jgi:manganese transport system ATP-binding protein
VHGYDERIVPIVRASDLELAYGDTIALAPSSFELPRGTLVSLVGPNGSGKSTLLRALAGLVPPRSGRLEVEARPAIVLQGTEVDRTLPITVREVVTLARYAHRGWLRRLQRADRTAVETALERLGITDLAAAPLHELSSGQRQRVYVAQGLAQDAALLLLDEAITGLDLVSQDLIAAATTEERDAGRTVVASTHDLVEAQRADLVLLLANRIVAQGPPGAVLTPGSLAQAYGARILSLPGGAVVVDDPHHHA